MKGTEVGYVVSAEDSQLGEVTRRDPFVTDKIKCLWRSGTPCRNDGDETVGLGCGRGVPGSGA